MSMIRTHTKAWESVPRAAAEDLRLSCQTRGVLFWLLTRPSDWCVRIDPMMRLTGITKHTWPKIRDELIKAGYLVAKKGRTVAGKITWNFDVYSISIIEPSPDLPGVVKPSMVKRVTTDTRRTNTAITEEAHTRPPHLGERKKVKTKVSGRLESGVAA
ncbi:MAG: hypothetical protein Q8L80_00885 [Gallionella sp.]|nr:hypothetical protein [Gallionella sp.]